MSKNYNNNIIIHDFTQKLNFYAKNNFFLDIYMSKINQPIQDIKKKNSN